MGQRVVIAGLAFRVNPTNRFPERGDDAYRGR
jgi:hypothetical protein